MVEISQNDIGEQAPVKEKPSLVSETQPSDIRFLLRGTLTDKLVKDLDQGRSFNLPQCQTLMARLLEQNRLYGYHDEEGYIIEPRKVDWPIESQTATTLVDSMKSRYGRRFSAQGRLGDNEKWAVAPGKSLTFPKGVELDKENGSDLSTVAIKVFGACEPGAARQFYESALEQITDFSYCLEGDFQLDMQAMLIASAHRNLNSEDFYSVVFDTLLSRKNLIENLDYSSEGGISGSTGEWIITHTLWAAGEANVIKNIALFPDSEKQKELLGIFTHMLTFPNVINHLRTIKDSNISQDQKDLVEKLGKSMLGGSDERPFYTKLADLYGSIKFEEYKPNADDLEREINLIEDNLSLDAKQGVLVDMGTGTGRIAFGLAEKGFKKVIGVDNADRNIQTAQAIKDRSEVRQHRENTTFVQGDWKKLPFKDGTIDNILSVGRSLPHAESQEALAKILSEVSRSLKDKGAFIFDLPNPDKGSYLDNRKKYIKFLENCGLPIEKWNDTEHEDEVMQNMEYIIDSPDGKHFYNRYVPQQKTLEQLLKRAGFSLEEIARAPIGTSEDETVYYKAVKIGPVFKPTFTYRGRMKLDSGFESSESNLTPSRDNEDKMP